MSGSVPRNKRTYLITRCVGRIARSRNEQILGGSLDPFASRHDRYRLELWGYKPCSRLVSQGSSSELACMNTGVGDPTGFGLEGGEE